MPLSRVRGNRNLIVNTLVAGGRLTAGRLSDNGVSAPTSALYHYRASCHCQQQCYILLGSVSVSGSAALQMELVLKTPYMQ